MEVILKKSLPTYAIKFIIVVFLLGMLPEHIIPEGFLKAKCLLFVSPGFYCCIPAGKKIDVSVFFCKFSKCKLNGG
jgi:hypothetical protein